MDPQTLQSLCQQSQQIPLLVFAWTLLSAALLITALRLYSASKQSIGIAIDDYFALASMIVAATAISFLTIWIHFGLGRHYQCPDDPQFTLFWSFLTQILSIMGICLLKISICSCIRRVLEPNSSLFRYSIHLITFFIVASHIAQIVLLFLQCKPLNAIWTAGVQGASCFNHDQLSIIYYVGYSLDTTTDLICASMPAAVLYRLRLSNRSRIGICMLIGFGTLITGCSVLKTVTMSGAWATDFTWKGAIPVWFTIAEYYGGIVLASIPRLAGLISPGPKSYLNHYDTHSMRNNSLHSMPRKGSAWTLGPQRRHLLGAAKKHFSISTFGMSEGEEGSRLTIIDNRLAVFEEDEDRLTGAAHGRGDATLNGRNIAWNQEDVFGLGILGKDDTFGREKRSIRIQDGPNAGLKSARPIITKSASLSAMSLNGSPESPSFLRTPGTLKKPRTPIARKSTTSSIYPESPTNGGLSTDPSPSASTNCLPAILEVSPTPMAPETPLSPFGKQPAKSTINNDIGFSRQMGFNSRTLQGTTSRGFRQSTPNRLSLAVPRSKYQAEISQELAAEIKNLNQMSEIGDVKSATVPETPLELSIIDSKVSAELDSHD